jgi:hypothetical protein
MTNKNAKAKAPSNYITAKLAFYKDLPDEVYNEIIDVLKKTKFNKISFPLNTYRYLIDETVDDIDTRMATVGYIKRFDADKLEFTVAVYPKSHDAVAAFENPVVEVVWTEFKGKLGVITKLNIVPDEE